MSSRAQLLAELAPRIADERVLRAIATVRRAPFLPPDVADREWDNTALPIPLGQTVSQPLVVARMLELLEITPGDRVLDIGTGSGWHAALLAELGARVWSIERHAGLARSAAAALAGTGVAVRHADGSAGWAEEAPFDAVNVAASAAGDIPRALVDQLGRGGRLVAPVGERLVRIVRRPDGTLRREDHGGVRFVPLVSGRIA